MKDKFPILIRFKKIINSRFYINFLTLSTCSCQYSSCIFLAGLLLIREKNVGDVKYKLDDDIPNVSAIF